MRARLLILLAAALAAAPVMLLLAAPGSGAVAGLVALAALLVGAVVVLYWARLMVDLEALRRYFDTAAVGELPPPPQGWLLRRLGLAAALSRFLQRLQEQRQHAAGRHRRAEAVLQGLPDPLIVLDRERRIVRLNPAARALLGVRSEGRELTQLLRQPELYDAIASVAAGGGEANTEIRQTGGIERDYLCHVSLSAARDAEAGEILVLLRDITEIRRSAEMRVDFVANASHEIRTPLATIVGCIETLQGPARDDVEARRRFLAIMQQQAERMSRLVEDLLSLSRIELNEHQPPRGRVAIDDLLRQVLDELALTAEAANVALALKVEDALPAVSGDAEQLAQVFRNLVDNGVKYGAAGGRVEVSARHAAGGTAGTMVAVAVRDYGPGIAAEHRPRLTERFYRVDVAESRAQGGTGLGLALVKHVLNRHGGRLTIESTPGQGAAFVMHVPLPTDETGIGKEVSEKS